VGEGRAILRHRPLVIEDVGLIDRAWILLRAGKGNWRSLRSGGRWVLNAIGAFDGDRGLHVGDVDHVGYVANAAVLVLSIQGDDIRAVVVRREYGVLRVGARVGTGGELTQRPVAGNLVHDPAKRETGLRVRIARVGGVSEKADLGAFRAGIWRRRAVRVAQRRRRRNILGLDGEVDRVAGGRIVFADVSDLHVNTVREGAVEVMRARQRASGGGRKVLRVAVAPIHVHAPLAAIRIGERTEIDGARTFVNVLLTWRGQDGADGRHAAVFQGL